MPQIINAMETIVKNLFVEFQKNYRLKCACDECQTDILVLTLNRIPPKYVSSQTGELYIKTLYLNSQLQSDVLRELSRAVLIVEKTPHRSRQNKE